MKTVLIVEDNKLIRDVLAWRLGMHLKGCDILQATNGREGVDILKSTAIDFILTDLFMPVMDGFGIIEYRNRHLPWVPVFVMTGMYSAQVREQLGLLGIKHCIEKPFDFDIVSQQIAQILGESSAPNILPQTAHVFDRQTAGR